MLRLEVFKDLAGLLNSGLPFFAPTAKSLPFGMLSRSPLPAEACWLALHNLSVRTRLRLLLQQRAAPREGRHELRLTGTVRHLPECALSALASSPSCTPAVLAKGELRSELLLYPPARCVTSCDRAGPCVTLYS